MANRNGKNIKNTESFLFKGLTRIFSGPISNFHRQNVRNYKRNQLDKYHFKSASGKEFRKSSSSPLSNLYAMSKANVNRAERYMDFDAMEFVGEINSALDIYASEMTMSSALSKMLTINCANEEIKGVLENLYHNILNVDFNLFGWCRSLCKYGDAFVYLDIDENMGITSFMGLPAMEVERLEGEDKTNPNYVQYQWNSGGLTFENWQVAHFRILGNDKFSPYGTSCLDPVRRIFRQLQLQEDAMMAYRVVRSPDRRVFYIDVGGIPEKDVEQFMQKIVTELKRNQIVDPDTGKIDMRMNVGSISEDFYIPVVGNTSATRIETLPGGSYVGDIDDVKYLRDKLMSGLKIPHSYLIGTEGAIEDKTTLSQKDIQFAKTIQRLQKSVISELEKIGIIHLYVLGYRANDLVSFSLRLNNPSKIAELQELEHWKTKFDVASAATEGFFSRRWVAKNILNMTDEEFLRNTREMFFDAQLSAELEMTSTPEEDIAAGDLGSELGSSEGEPEQSDDVLLAAPGKEPEGILPEGPITTDFSAMAPKMVQKGHVTAGSNGKVYVPAKVDKRGGGARLRHMRSLYSDESGRATSRNVFKGGNELRALSRGIFENYETNYKKTIFEELDEKKKLESGFSNEDLDMAESTKTIEKIIEGLEGTSWKNSIRKKVNSDEQ